MFCKNSQEKLTTTWPFGLLELQPFFSRNENYLYLAGICPSCEIGEPPFGIYCSFESY